MNINVRTNISDNFQDIEVIINAPERNAQIYDIENKLQFINQI